MNYLLKAERYSHGVRLSGYTRELFQKLLHFLERLELKEPNRDQWGRVTMELKKRYYGLREDHREIFIHRNNFKDLLGYLTNIGVPEDRIEIVDIPIPAAEPAVFRVKDHLVPRDYQVPIIEALVNTEYSRRLDLYTGYGKDQPLTAKIKTPGGWTTMGEIQVGDKITAWDGTTTKVTGVYPQGKRTVFKLTFADGRTTRAGGQHLWKVYTTNAYSTDGWSIQTTEELLRLKNLKGARVYVPLCLSEEGVDQPLPIPPYTLGVILGDGGLTSGVSISKGDPEIFEHLQAELPEGLRLVECDNITKRVAGTGRVGGNAYRTALQELGLFGKKSIEKFIPEIYKRGSTQQRLELLQGILDTDGHAQKAGTVTFYSSSYRLAKDVQYLVRSLGGIARLGVKEPKYTYNGETRKGNTAYRVNIRFTQPSALFRLTRKKERMNDENQYAKNLKLRLEAVEVDGYEETRCISIEHPDHLYITDEFIVTHNTMSALSALARLGVRGVVMIQPKYFGIWIKALRETYEDIEGRYCTVSGSSELKALMEQAAEGELRYDIIIISMVTYRAYLEAYERFGEAITEIGYLCPPPRFHELLGAGVQINDEIQDDPGLVFRTDIFTNIAKQFYLSATPYTGNAMVTRMIDVMLPEETQCPLPEYNSYINTVAMVYSDPGITKGDYLTPFKNTYNHARYETRMLKKRRRLDRYFAMVRRLVYGLYVKDRIPGQKLLVLCATVKFIEALTRYLQQEFPDLVVGQHVAGSDPRKLQTNDITVSTIKSAGTGQDIIDLREVLLLQATDSKKDNIQILGRLRPLKNFPEHTPRLTYLVCADIPQQIRYYTNKQEHFRGRVKSHRTMRI